MTNIDQILYSRNIIKTTFPHLQLLLSNNYGNKLDTTFGGPRQSQRTVKNHGLFKKLQCWYTAEFMIKDSNVSSYETNSFHSLTKGHSSKR